MALSTSGAASSFNSQLDLISYVVIYIQGSQQQSRSYKFVSAALLTRLCGLLHHKLTLLLSLWPVCSSSPSGQQLTSVLMWGVTCREHRWKTQGRSDPSGRDQSVQCVFQWASAKWHADVLSTSTSAHSHLPEHVDILQHESVGKELENSD